MKEDDDPVTFHTVAVICTLCDQLAAMAASVRQERLRTGLDAVAADAKRILTEAGQEHLLTRLRPVEH
jgi:hypothetical protein